jgi:hypothetical protein
LEVARYVRQDDSSKENYAKVFESGRLVLQPPEVDSTLPLNDGIHSIGNPDDDLVVTASIYGKPLRRLFVNRFDVKNERVERVYPPKIRKKSQAKRALALLEGKT